MIDIDFLEKSQSYFLRVLHYEAGLPKKSAF
jgi:hypothetical protein